MLVLTRRVNERIIIGDDVEVTVVEIRGEQVKIGIEAPKDTKVYRKEIFDEIQAENKRALSAEKNIDEVAEQMSKILNGTGKDGGEPRLPLEE
jgi:carbon storage regulator